MWKGGKKVTKVKLLNESKELYSGVFWIKDLENISSNTNTCFLIPTSSDGTILSEISVGASNSGLTYNHQRVWSSLSKEITDGKPFDYFPRGRVQITNSKAIVYLNPNINFDEVQKFIVSEYNLTKHNGIEKVIFNSDGSDHYKCYLDK